MLHTHPSVYLQAAKARRGSHAVTIGATVPWQHWRASLWGAEVRGYWDASLSRWAADGAHHNRVHSTVLEVTPSFRLVPNAGRSPFFLDAGVGASLANHRYVTQNAAFSTRLNFASHIGAGFAFGDQRRHEIQLRIHHVSNAGLKKPNPGETFVQLRYALHF